MVVDSDRWSVCWQMYNLLAVDGLVLERRQHMWDIGQPPVDICYYRVGVEFKNEMSSAFGRVFAAASTNGYLRQTVESICAFCLVHGPRYHAVGGLLIGKAFNRGGFWPDPGHSTCWFPPPTRQAAHRGRVSKKKSHTQKSLMHGSAGHADES